MIPLNVAQLIICFIAWHVDDVAATGQANSVYANFSIKYDFVATDEIVLLQNAIEDVEMIVNMSVKRISINSLDVLPTPSNVDVKAKSPTEILVSWNLTTAVVVVNGTVYRVAGYTVFVKEYGTSKWMRYATTKKSSSLIIGRLKPYTLYTVRMLAYHDAGNGIASDYIDVKTKEGVPSTAPEKLKCEPQSPSEILLQWNSLPVTDWKGFAKGYFLYFYAYQHEAESRNVSVPSSDTTVMLHKMKAYTNYEIYIQAETGAGKGPRAACFQKTLEGVPSIGPPIVSAELDVERPTEAVVIWNPIPKEYVNGNLIGYTVYWGITRDGKDRREFPAVLNSKKVDQYTNLIRIENMGVDIEMKVWIVGRTQVGEGAERNSNPVYVETCKCPRYVYAAWFDNPPYVKKIDKIVDGKMTIGTEGIFPTYLHKMISTLCAECNSLKGRKNDTSSKLYWDRSKDGRSPIRADEKRLKELVSNEIYFHVAINGRSEVHNFQSIYRFVGIVESPGIAFIVRDPLQELNKTKEIMNSLAKCWPAIIIIILFSMVSGIIMWVLDCKENQEEFPNESFLQGLYHGTYWAFVSMTTVGYGDKTPRSFVAQCVAICWMLMGPIINGIVVGAITTSLTTISLQSDPKIYGSLVGAINDSFEYNLGVRRNAKMNTNGIGYANVDELVESLAAKEVTGILVDSLKAQSLGPTLREKKMKISQIIPEKSGSGVILAGDILKMEDEIRSYVDNNADEMKETIKNITKQIDVKSEGPTEIDTGLVDPKSETFIGIVKYGLISIGVCIVLAVIIEFLILKYRRAKVVPYNEAHRMMLEDNVSSIITDFCDEVPSKLKSKTDEHESELKRFFWRKGYSFGIDGWLRQKTSDEEKIKKEIRYQEIMNEDLGLYKPPIVWSQPKAIAKALKHETQKVGEKIHKAKESMKDTIDDFI